MQGEIMRHEFARFSVMEPDVWTGYPQFGWINGGGVIADNTISNVSDCVMR